MDFSILAEFRRKTYACFNRAADALMHVIDRTALQKLFAQYAPEPKEGERLLVGGDASSILRTEAKTARDRTYVHASSLPEGTKPVRPGWPFSEIAVLPNEQGSFVSVLDNRRIQSTQAQGQVMAEQLQEATERIARRFLFWGEEAPALEAVSRLYARRYNLEHGYRTAKQDLLWETPRLRAPEQFERWTAVASVVRNTLFLARYLVSAHRQPWERECRARTPEQVRRAMGRIIAQLGTPARLCRPRGYSPGWQQGRSRQPVPTYKMVYKACEKTAKVEKLPSSGVPPACVAA